MTADPGDGWHALMLAMDLEPGSVAGCVLRGRELAVWRDARGVAHVWDDRCPHRGMRLSLGFLREGTLACLYHGWRFGPDGRCAHIPAHPELSPPATIRAAPWAAVERHGLIWARPAAEEGEAPGVEIGAGGHVWTGAWTGVRSLRVGAPAERVAGVIGLAAGRLAGVLDRDVHGAVLAAILPVDGDACMLHVLAGGMAGAARLHALADWARDMRGCAEEAA